MYRRAQTLGGQIFLPSDHSKKVIYYQLYSKYVLLGFCYQGACFSDSLLCGLILLKHTMEIKRCCLPRTQTSHFKFSFVSRAINLLNLHNHYSCTFFFFFGCGSLWISFDVFIALVLFLFCWLVCPCVPLLQTGFPFGTIKSWAELSWRFSGAL